jgi:hypothetical protein
LIKKGYTLTEELMKKFEHLELKADGDSKKGILLRIVI